MKNQRSEVAILLAVGWLVVPQLTLPAAGQPGTAERQIRELEVQRREALLRRDTRVLDRIFADDYMIITSSGEVLTKSQLLERVESGRDAPEPLNQEDVKVRVYGNVAVQTSLDTYRGREKGQPAKVRVTRVYVNQEGGWRLASVQGTFVAK